MDEVILLVDCDEAARRLGFDADKVRELTDAGELPSHRFGEAVRYRVADLEAFAAGPPLPVMDEAVLLVDRKEAARRLGLGTRKVWELTNTRELPAVNIGRAVRYRIVDLGRFVAGLPAVR